VPAGSYSVTAVATDDRNASTTSAAATVTVNAQPTVTLTGPADGATYTAPAGITLTATATDGDGNIAHVDFFNGTTPIGSATAAPYTFAWNNVPAGTYALTAQATDNLGATIASAVVNVTVNDAVVGAGVYYIYADQLNTPRAITDSSNKVIWRWDSDPFGMTPADEDPDRDGVKMGYNLRFPGQYFDRETGLHYNYYRDYDPSTGRYVESDPIGLAGGINTYAYVGGSPASYIDPTGEILINPITIGAAIGGVAGAIQAANSSGGWSWANAGNIAIGAVTGAVAGAIPGGVAARVGLGVTIGVGAAAGAGGNLANQWAGGASLACTNWAQAAVQGGAGALSGAYGYGAGLSSALGVLRSGGSVQGALAFGNIYGAITGGVAQISANLPISTNLGGFMPFPIQTQCGCSN